MLVSDQLFSKTRYITHDNEEILLMTKKLNHHEGLTHFNLIIELQNM